MSHFGNVNVSESKTRIEFYMNGESFLLTANKDGFIVHVDQGDMYVRSDGDNSVKITTSKLLGVKE